MRVVWILWWLSMTWWNGYLTEFDLTYAPPKSNETGKTIELPWWCLWSAIIGCYIWDHKGIMVNLTLSLLDRDSMMVHSSHIEVVDLLTKEFRFNFSLTITATPVVNYPITLYISSSIVKFEPLFTKEMLRRLNSHKPSGFDAILPKLLRECADLFWFPFVILFKCFLAMDNLPSDWKVGVVIPVYNGGGLTFKASNYRPISCSVQ